MSIAFNPFSASFSVETKDVTIILLLMPPNVNISLGSILAINRFPYGLAIKTVEISVAIAPTGANLIVDMLKNNVSMMTTKLSIDSGEFSSTTATAPPVLSSTTLAVGDKLSFNVDQIGATIPGQYLTVTLRGERV